MGRSFPANGAPIGEQELENIADSYGHDSEDVRTLVEIAQEQMGEMVGMYYDGQVVGETESWLITLASHHFRDEVDEAIHAYEGEVGDQLEEDLPHILSEVQHTAFESSAGQKITGYSEQEAANAISANYPRVIRKPEDERPTFEDIDVEYRIQYDKGYQAPYHFVARAWVTISGVDGTLVQHRAVRAIPDDSSDEPRDEIVVSADDSHKESDTLIDDYISRHSIDDQLMGDSSLVDEYDIGLRWWVHELITADFQLAYESIEDSLPLCDNCRAWPHHASGVWVEQRDTHQFDPSVPDTMCNICYAQVLEAETSLSGQEAEVAAAMESATSHSAVANAVGGIDENHVGTVAGRIREKIERAQRTDDLVNIE